MGAELGDDAARPLLPPVDQLSRARIQEDEAQQVALARPVEPAGEKPLRRLVPGAGVRNGGRAHRPEPRSRRRCRTAPAEMRRRASAPCSGSRFPASSNRYSRSARPSRSARAIRAKRGRRHRGVAPLLDPGVPGGADARRDAATSSRRSPGVRRRPALARPISAGLSRSRCARMKSPSSRRCASSGMDGGLYQDKIAPYPGIFCILEKRPRSMELTPHGPRSSVPRALSGRAGAGQSASFAHWLFLVSRESRMFESLSNRLERCLRPAAPARRAERGRCRRRAARNPHGPARGRCRAAGRARFRQRACASKAVGQEVLRSVTPGQMVVKIVHDHLVEVLGGEDGPSRRAASTSTPRRRSR